MPACAPLLPARRRARQAPVGARPTAEGAGADVGSHNAAWERLTLATDASSANARSNAPIPHLSRAAEHVARDTYTVGNASVTTDYTDLAKGDAPAKYQSTIETRLAKLAGKLDKKTRDAISKLSTPQRRWLLFALDLIGDNPQPGLDRKLAATRLLDYAPAATASPPASAPAATTPTVPSVTPPPSTPPAATVPPTTHDFENEVLRASGWYELALAAKLAAPSATTQKQLDIVYNPGGGAAAGASSCPPKRPALDQPKLESELGSRVKSFLSSQASLAAAANPVQESPANTAPLADRVQSFALQFFSPYIGRSHTRAFQQSWTFSSHLRSSTDAGAIPAGVRRAFLDNRALDKLDAPLVASTHYDDRCPADVAAYTHIVDTLDADAGVQKQLDVVMSWLSFTEHNADAADVTLNTQHQDFIDDCDARWALVQTMCHEVLHAYVSQDFAAKAGARQLTEEGFTEVLGEQLYSAIKARAESDATVRKTFQAGLRPHACDGATIPDPRRGYKAAADDADKILAQVHDDNFRAAYFLGRTELAGLK